MKGNKMKKGYNTNDPQWVLAAAIALSWCTALAVTILAICSR
jgi:hypothetical protein